ncbi:hypothetical protein BZL29_7714 [Mycobacterium kansasii]|uniref:Uncharacterized protein n=1 Tax=Mycobacterium kansasii TaxID=1768 RepID=A0A1V3WEQ9_MYCKA|nr:hypothetical protein BZL29_7714 [Mycobacterium kansasii]
MTTTRCAPPRRPRPQSQDFASVVSATRLQLCAVREDPETRTRHVAAVLAFTPIDRLGQRMRIHFDDGPTALWVAQALAHKDAELVDVGADGGTIIIANPQTVLGRYGFRDGRWLFGQGMPAAVGVSRGAVHAAANFNRQGMKVACPSASMMLTLIAVLSRLGIHAKPTDGHPRAAVGPGRVPQALARLGIAEVGAQYRRLRENPRRDLR